MARSLVTAQLVLNPDGSLAQNVPFTLWSDSSSGIQYTDVVAPDGTSSISLITTSEGLIPEFRLPDGIKGVWVDTGAEFRQYVYSAEALNAKLLEPTSTGGGSGTGVSDHGLLTGLADDDHAQYLTTGRGDARYYTKTQADTATTIAVMAASTNDRARANHTGTQAIGTITGLEDRLVAAEAGSGGGSGIAADTDGAYYISTLGGGGSGTGGGGNAYMITGATAARVNPIDGTALPAGARVIWVAESSPVNGAPGDIWFNGPTL